MSEPPAGDCSPCQGPVGLSSSRAGRRSILAGRTPRRPARSRREIDRCSRRDRAARLASPAGEIDQEQFAKQNRAVQVGNVVQKLVDRGPLAGLPDRLKRIAHASMRAARENEVVDWAAGSLQSFMALRVATPFGSGPAAVYGSAHATKPVRDLVARVSLQASREQLASSSHRASCPAGLETPRPASPQIRGPAHGR